MPILQLGTLNAAGTTFTSVVDLSGSTTIGARTMTVALVRDTFKVTAPARNAQFSSANSRYGGAVQSSESLSNGTIAASLILNGATATEAVDNWEFILSKIELGDTTQYYIKWQPESATNPVFYEVRGLASWQALYRWIEFQSNRSLVFEVSWPVAPLARGLTTSFASTTITSPGKVTVAVTGTAPALLDIAVDNSSTPLTASWAMVAWSGYDSAASAATAQSPFTAVAKPFGVLDIQGTGTYDQVVAGSGGSVSRQTSQSDCLNGTRAAFSIPTAVSTAQVLMSVDPSMLDPDSFSSQTCDIEIWARIRSNTRTPKLLAFIQDDTGTTTYSNEYGAAGKVIPAYTGWRLVKLGTFTVPTNITVAYTVEMTAIFDSAGSSETFYVDYMLANPAKARAMGPTGKTPDANYPSFGALVGSSGTVTTKLIKSNLAGLAKDALSSSVYVPAAGLGGQSIEVPVTAGSVDLFFKMSDAVPDDPANTYPDTAVASVGVSGYITPRYYLARGT